MLGNVEEIPCSLIVAVNYKDLAFLSKVTKISCQKDFFNAGVAGIIFQNEQLERIGMPNIKEVVTVELIVVNAGITEYVTYLEMVNNYKKPELSGQVDWIKTTEKANYILESPAI